MDYLKNQLNEVKDDIQDFVNDDKYNPDDEPIPNTSSEPDLTLDDTNENIYNTLGDDLNEFKKDMVNLKHKFPVEERQEPESLYSTTLQNIYKFFFNRFNLIIITWFLAIFITIYGFLRIFTKTDVVTDDAILISRLVDFITFSFIFVIVICPQRI